MTSGRSVPAGGRPSSRTRVATGSVAAVTVAWCAMAAGCAPAPTAIERYCDVVHQSEAAFDPFTTPGAVTDPMVLRKALSDQIATATALGDAAPEAVHTDATTVRSTLSRIANALAAKDYDASKVDGDKSFSALVADPSFQDARRRLDDFNANRCA